VGGSVQVKNTAKNRKNVISDSGPNFMVEEIISEERAPNNTGRKS
jgi:hypothetical protein